MTAMFDIIKGDLERLDEVLLEAVRSSDGFVEEVCEYVITSGGKRLRPALFLLSARGGGRFSIEKALPLGAALELIHTASLVHDDVIDEANLRRGVPTLNAKWGQHISVLAGDFIFAAAFRLIAGRGYDERVSGLLAELVSNLAMGEIAETRASYQVDDDTERYLSRIQKKTADFLKTCCELGGIIGGMSEKDTANLAAYGHNIGMAFQIIDDVLDIQEDSATIGKPAGNDIRQGIITLPVIRALKVSKRRDELQTMLKDADRTEESLAIVRATDGVEYSLDIAKEYIKTAKESLPESLTPEVRECFVTAADFVGDRHF